MISLHWRAKSNIVHKTVAVLASDDARIPRRRRSAFRDVERHSQHDVERTRCPCWSGSGECFSFEFVSSFTNLLHHSD